MKYKVTRDNPTDGLSARSRVIFVYLRTVEAIHGRLATKDEVFTVANYSQRSFDRCWAELEAAHLIKVA